MDSPFSLQGKNILVTGASSGIGRAVAIECAKSKANLIITGRNHNRLEQTGQMIREFGQNLILFEGDLTDSDFISHLLSQIPEIQGLALCSGQVTACPTSFATEKKIKSLFATNFLSNVELIRLLLKTRRMKRGGAIAVITSVLGIDGVMPGNAIYGASKAALESWIKYCALEYAPKGIRFNTIHPGSIMTPMMDMSWSTEDQMETQRNKIPIGRFGLPEEVANSVVFLLSNASSYITGSSIIIDGGQHLLF